jgi:hypothetical protein
MEVIFMKDNDYTERIDEDDANRDPLTGETGAHPVGTGIGAGGAGVAGTVIGAALGGPVGGVIGAAIGSVAGGLVGKSVAEKVNPTVEDDYWRDNYANRPYAELGYGYEDYSHAYRTGYEGYSTYADRGMTYGDAEPELKAEYERRHGTGRLEWEKAKHATKDAWDRVERAIPGDSDRDGK